MKLASVEKIINIEPIPGADKIVKATILGWEVVILKGEYKPGDLVSYIMIDTIVPQKPEFEFLRDRKFRVRTIKLRKQISQGLIVPLPPGSWKEGDDLTEILGITKYSKDIEVEQSEEDRVPKGWIRKIWHKFLWKQVYRRFPSLKPKKKSGFPSHLVSKTDEERIQSMPSVLERYKDQLFVVSEKLDGSSITIIHEKKHSWLGFSVPKFRICSRNLELTNSNNEWYRVFYDTNFGEHILNLCRRFETENIIVQGEFIGKPQGNPYKLKSNEIRLFNIFVNGERLNQREFYAICWTYEIPCCPWVAQIPLNFTMAEILKYAEGKSFLNKDTEREGVVFRAVDGSLSFKVISNKFLLENEE